MGAVSGDVLPHFGMSSGFVLSMLCFFSIPSRRCNAQNSQWPTNDLLLLSHLPKPSDSP
jgi:hypothetical protein